MSKLRPPNAKYDVILASFTWAISEKESVQLHLLSLVYRNLLLRACSN